VRYLVENTNLGQRKGSLEEAWPQQTHPPSIETIEAPDPGGGADARHGYLLADCSKFGEIVAFVNYCHLRPDDRSPIEYRFLAALFFWNCRVTPSVGKCQFQCRYSEMVGPSHTWSAIS
jgi:hypothetical protein